MKTYVGLDAPAPKQMRTVLIVDDEEDVIYALQQTLQSLNYQMIATTDAKRALQILKNDSSIDLLITDLFMPMMDGATLLNRSRAIRSNLRAVLTTGAASYQELRRWRGKGELIVCKPWRDKELVDAVERAFNRAPVYSRR